ncbi:hypothetical protein JR065_16830 [Xanthomonas sp. AmX2]|uniref:hypothetical protein n=1 Tax=Xanthomonas sp. TaxID=29446 RepID=UPI00197F044E|nr:hypothetical protein [Xanthomonas sp.]MBN6152011.1 hypothetical protein [Xanthomonas sp.]
MRARIGKWLAWSAGGVVALVLAAYLVSRLWPVPPAQREALALLQQPRAPLRGPNLFAALWALPYAVPAAQQPALLEQDVQRFRQSRAAGGFGSALARQPRAPAWPATLPRCSWRDSDCLDKVRAQRQAYADALQAQAPVLARIAALPADAHYRSPFDARADTPLPELSLLRLGSMRHALDFADGRTDAALAGVCHDAQLGRILLRSDDSLIVPMVGAAMLRGNARLFAGMLAELPVQQPLPAQCAVAFAPLAAEEIGLCGAMRGEARMMFAAFDELGGGAGPPMRWYDAALLRLFDAERSKAMVAPRYAWSCGATARDALLHDRPAVEAPAQASASRSVGCLANAMGCVLAASAAPDVAPYQRSLQDAAAATRLVAALLWLREHPDAQPLPQRLAALPAPLRGSARPIQAATEGGVQVQAYSGREGDRLRLPLPGSRLRR